MDTSYHKKLLDHEHWANLRTCSMLTSLERIHPKSREIFNHIIAAQDNWYSRVKGTAPRLEIWWKNEDVLQWEKLLISHHQKWMELLEVPDIIDRKIRYRNTKGNEYTNTISEIILHLCLHSQYHRGQVIAYSRELIHAAPATDFIVFLRE